MKCVINNKLYDTDKAKIIWEHKDGYTGKTIYLTAKGNWFVVNYCLRPCTPTEAELFTLTEKEAAIWLAEYANKAILDKFFPGVIEDA